MGWVQAVEGGSGPTPGSSTTHSDGPAAEWWPSLCLVLGSLLQVNPDILRRQLVCELFSQGLDLSAEQVISSCSLVSGVSTSQLIFEHLCIIKPRQCWR